MFTGKAGQEGRRSDQHRNRRAQRLSVWLCQPLRGRSSAGTNPEETLGRPHAACFAMAFSFTCDKAGFETSAVDTKATVRLVAAGRRLSDRPHRAHRSRLPFRASTTPSSRSWRRLAKTQLPAVESARERPRDHADGYVADSDGASAGLIASPATSTPSSVLPRVRLARCLMPAICSGNRGTSFRRRRMAGAPGARIRVRGRALAAHPSRARRAARRAEAALSRGRRRVPMHRRPSARRDCRRRPAGTDR